MQYQSNLENVKRKNYGETEQNGSQVHLGKKKNREKSQKNSVQNDVYNGGQRTERQKCDEEDIRTLKTTMKLQ